MGEFNDEVCLSRMGFFLCESIQSSKWCIRSPKVKGFEKVFRDWEICSTRKECIPVRCVPAARWPYAGVCFPGRVVSALGGVSAQGGVCSWGCVWSWGGVCSLEGVCSWGCLLWGGCLLLGCLLLGGVSALGGCLLPGGGIPAWTEADTSPLWTESHTPVKTLPWPNFVAAGNDTNRNVLAFSFPRNVHYFEALPRKCFSMSSCNSRY